MINFPGILKGMRDYNALELYRRDYILSMIRSIYKCYGFEPLETPALEHSITLTGKYGDDGEQLIFHILKSGNFLKNIDSAKSWEDYKKIKKFITDKALRYDLTIPLIRYIAVNKHNIVFPFRRYQIQPVWRADRPQKGRYREFLQCDVDIVGSASLLCEAEVLKLIYDVLVKLNIQHPLVKINHRGILTAISNTQEDRYKEQAFCIIVDKLEKVGFEVVSSVLLQEGFAQETIQALDLLLNFRGNNIQLLEQLKTSIGHTVCGAKAIETLIKIINYTKLLGLPEQFLRIEPTLARGISYYTGLVVEATVMGSNIGSLGGGGRYDNLGSLFGITGLCGVGFSFGIDRLYDIMEQQQLFHTLTQYTTEILLTNIEANAEDVLLSLLNKLRSRGVKAEVYPECTKLKKQLIYADKKNIPFVLILGQDELLNHNYTLKNMKTGEQLICCWDQLCEWLDK